MNTDAVPLPCPMCNATLSGASASGYHYHPANGCIFSGFEVSLDDISAWNRRYPDVPTADAVPSELHEAARQFHNLTQGDSTVIIRAPSAEKRDAIIAAGEKLRAALVTHATQANHIADERKMVAATLPQPVLDALRFYAHGHHFSIDDDHQQFDTVSGEPQNWLMSEKENDCTMIEDGSIAKAVLLGGMPVFEEPTEPLEGEVFVPDSSTGDRA